MLKKILIAIAAIVVLLVILAVGGLLLLHNHLNSPAFTEKVRSGLSEELGTELRLERIAVSPFQGLTVHGFGTPHRDTQSGDFLTVTRFHAKVRLLPLLGRRIEIETLEVDDLNVLARMLEDGGIEFPIELEEKDPSEPSDSDYDPQNLHLIIEKIKIGPGNIKVLAADGSTFAAIDQLDLEGQLSIIEGTRDGSLTASIRRLEIVPGLSVENITTPVRIENDTITLEKILAEVYQGTSESSARLILGEVVKYDADVKATGVDMPQFMAALGKDPQTLGGRADATFKGSGNLDEPLGVAGGGTFIVHQPVIGKLREKAAAGGVSGLAGALGGIPPLRTGQFDTIEGDYVIQEQTIQLNRLDVLSESLKINIDGTIDFDQNLDLRGRVHINSAILGGLATGAQTLVRGFLGSGSHEDTAAAQIQQDLKGGIPFSVTGNAENPVVRTLASDPLGIIRYMAQVLGFQTAGGGPPAATAPPVETGETPAEETTEPTPAEEKPTDALRRMLPF